MKKQNKKIINASISYLQISILIISTFAFAYLIADTSSLVKAETTGNLNCCLQDKNSTYCQNIYYGNCDSECNTACIPTACQEVAECSGCCIDKDEGTCLSNSPRVKCEGDGGDWIDDSFCNDIQGRCQKGCCFLGSNTALTTQKECEKLTILNGFSIINFTQGMTEMQCVVLAKTQRNGACMIASGDEEQCKATSEQDCIRLQGEFHANYLCTAKELNSGCYPTDKTTCVQGKDEVYFTDTCGNVANIYDSSKIYNVNDNATVDYWTKPYSKENSCNINRGNINSDICGNCDFALGSKCSQDNGKNICTDLNCYDVPLSINGKGEVLLSGDKKNAESWCIYESAIGNETQDLHVGDTPILWGLRKIPIIHTTQSGTDPVGSRHFMATCINGEYNIDACNDYRNSICVENTEIINDTTGETFTAASCKTNLWQDCLNYNTGEDNNEAMKECVKNTDCYVKRVDVDNYFKFDFCMPKYKPALDFTGKDGDAKDVCSIGTTTCTYVEVKDIDGDWNCEYNCDCKTKEFTLKMNEFCRSLGDCGAQVNIVGNITTAGFKVSGAPGLSTKDLKDLSFDRFTEPIPNKTADVGNLTEYLKVLGLPPELSQQENILSSYYMGGIMGAMGAFYAGGILHGWSNFLITGPSPSAFGGHFGTFVPYFGVVAAGIAGFSVGYMVGKGLGLSNGVATALGVIIGITVAYAGFSYFFAESVYASVSWGAAFPPLMIALVIVWALLKIFGVGDTRTIEVTATCLPWAQPVGGADCHLCNENSYLPCNKYECISLGSACKFVNPNTDSAMCIASQNNRMPPIISALKFENNYSYEIFTSGGKETGYEIKDISTECLSEWTNVLLSITTDKASICKIDTLPNINFTGMANYLDSTLYEYNHTLRYLLPSASALGAQGYDPSRLAQMNFYVKCQDDWGNTNIGDYLIRTCVKPEPDTTVARIEKFVPVEEDAYIGYQQTAFNFTFYTNEPAECKYSFNDKNYSAMENYINCTGALSFTPTSMYGFPCNAFVTGIANNKTNLNIRCKDQPWYKGTNESLRNENTESTPYNIKLSPSQLKIISISPSGEITAGNEPFTIELRGETTGGCCNGESTCEFSYDNSTFARLQDYDTSLQGHLYKLTSMPKGDHYLALKCQDKAKNIAYADTFVTLNLDHNVPAVTRVYSQGSVLNIETSEDSTCAYSTKSCSFVFDENATIMNGIGKEHSTGINLGKTYYIKCKDIYNNMPSGCSIKVNNY